MECPVFSGEYGKAYLMKKIYYFGRKNYMNFFMKPKNDTHLTKKRSLRSVIPMERILRLVFYFMKVRFLPGRCCSIPWCREKGSSPLFLMVCRYLSLLERTTRFVPGKKLNIYMSFFKKREASVQVFWQNGGHELSQQEVRAASRWYESRFKGGDRFHIDGSVD